MSHRGQVGESPLELGGQQRVGPQGGADHARQARPPGPRYRTSLLDFSVDLQIRTYQSNADTCGTCQGYWRKIPACFINKMSFERIRKCLKWEASVELVIITGVIHKIFKNVVEINITPPPQLPTSGLFQALSVLSL